MKITKIKNRMGGVFLGLILIGGIIYGLGQENQIKEEALANQLITEEAVIECLKECKVEEYLSLKEDFKNQQKAFEKTQELTEKINQEIIR